MMKTNNSTLRKVLLSFCLLHLKRAGFVCPLALAAVLSGSFFFASCSDNIDESNLYSFTGKQVATFLDEREDLTDFRHLCQRVKLSPKSESTVYDLLSARGNYTCFAPNNEAIHQYVDSLMGQPDYDLDLITDSIANLIVRNCLVDCGNDAAYRSVDFMEGVLPTRNLNDRYITIQFRYNPETDRSETVLNNSAVIKEGDMEVENGYVHIVDAVPSVSMSTLPDLMRTIPNIRIFTRLLKETGWDKKMVAYQDEEYEWNHPEYGRPTHPGSEANYLCPPHRRYGYTAFPETDSVYQHAWGCPEPVLDKYGEIGNWDEIFSVIENHCKQIGTYNKDGHDGEYTHEDNCVNQFVAYHLLPMSMAYNNMVIHYCELGFGYANPSRLTVNVNEYYTVMGKHRRLMKFTEGPTTDGIRINRHYGYDLETYDENAVYVPGIKVNAFNDAGLSYALNGFYYVIDKILAFDEYVRDNTLNERIRIETASMHPELITAGLRRPYKGIYYNLPANFLADIIRSNETEIIYKTSWGPQWYDYEGDEFLMLGQYDFTFVLPPVPYDGTYEIRWGLSNTGGRGMAQLYFGTDPTNLAAIGLPLDMRLNGDDPNIGWVKDDPEDPDANRQNDKNLRNKGYMKAPAAYCFPNATRATAQMRNLGPSIVKIRRILHTTTLKANEKYYMRFKSILTNPDAQFFYDYLELVPKSVYADPSKPEDIW